MSDLEQLRRRVEAAERHFGSMGEQQGKYSARLVQLMDQIERRAAERESELSHYIGELQHLRRDHDQVKSMLKTLLAAIEAGGGDAVMAALHEMDRKASALVGEVPAGEMPRAAREPQQDEAALEATGTEDLQNGFEDVAEEVLAAEEAELPGEAEIEAAPERFEDVTPGTLAAEEAQEQTTAVEDEIFPEAQPAAEAGAPSATAESPVAGIIQRIGQLTRELAEQPTPAKTPTAPAEPSKLRRAAS
jgi:predicted  nucleic acid-binding Zn-ribbon protein